jgi:hypothetical protein
LKTPNKFGKNNQNYKQNRTRNNRKRTNRLPSLEEVAIKIQIYLVYLKKSRTFAPANEQ